MAIDLTLKSELHVKNPEDYFLSEFSADDTHSFVIGSKKDFLAKVTLGCSVGLFTFYSFKGVVQGPLAFILYALLSFSLSFLFSRGFYNLVASLNRGISKISYLALVWHVAFLTIIIYTSSLFM